MSDIDSFIKRLNEVQNLMDEEKYEQAAIILEELKVIERNGDFDYSLTHQLYQLNSNVHSLLNQKKLFKIIKDISKSNESITFKNLLNIINSNENGLNLEESLLKREIELLILRGKISCSIVGDTLKFSQNYE